MTIKLLTTSACPKCPIAKEMLDNAKLVYSILVDDDAVNEATRLGISTVPTLVDDLDQIFCGINEIQRFINNKMELIKTEDGEILE